MQHGGICVLQTQFSSFTFIFQRKLGWMFHVNPLLEKIRLDVSCESSAIHRLQFSLANISRLVILTARQGLA